MPNLCGVNQKQLSDALLEIKRSASGGKESQQTQQQQQQQINGVGHKFKVDWADASKDNYVLLQNLFRPQTVGSVDGVSAEKSTDKEEEGADTPKQFKLQHFQIQKVLGKGSFGKVGDGQAGRGENE